MRNNDDKILELKKQIEAKKKELNKDPRFVPITNCIYKGNLTGTNENINTWDIEKLELEITKLTILKNQADELEFKLKYSFFPIEDWIEDMKNRREYLLHSKKSEELKKLEKRLDSLLSSDKKIELALNEIEDLLK